MTGLKKYKFILLFLLFTSCKNEEIGNSKDVNPSTIHTTFLVASSEDMDQVRCMAKFRFAGENGTTLVLNDPLSIAVDGQKLKLDSSKFDGAFYERYFNKSEFGSNLHSFDYTNSKGKTVKVNFNFQPFTLSNPLPSVINKFKAMTIEFNGLKNGNVIHCVASDTSFNTNDKTRDFTLKGNSITIPSSFWDGLYSGPVELDFSTNSLKNVNITSEGGKISIHYALTKRQIKLQ